MGAVNRDLLIEQGVTWTQAWQVQLDGADLDPVDGWQARSQVRTGKTAVDVLWQFDATVTGTIVQLSVNPTDSSAWTWRRGIYDVEIFDVTGRVVRLVEGSVVVDTEVTR